jgi:hypothetical protein
MKSLDLQIIYQIKINENNNQNYKTSFNKIVCFQFPQIYSNSLMKSTHSTKYWCVWFYQLQSQQSGMETNLDSTLTTLFQSEVPLITEEYRVQSSALGACKGKKPFPICS